MIMGENHRQEVKFWPRLLAKTLLRSRLESSSFRADIMSKESSSSHETVNLERTTFCKAQSDDRKRTHKYKLFASTWNVGGFPPSNDLNLEDWLDTNNNSYDIYVLGFQEIIPLNAKNILGPKKTRIAMRWNSAIGETLNKTQSIPKGCQDPSIGEKQRVYPMKDDDSTRGGISQGFDCIISKQMVGILVSVWIRHDLRQFIRHPSISTVGCGVMGFLGNKGSISVRFLLQETSFCFVCCHLASGGKEGDHMQRNSHAMEIFSRTRFPRVSYLSKILDHDRIILLGDLNYRISMPHSRTRSLVEQKQWEILLEKDQLKGEVSDGQAFEGWNEGDIAFSPTYKYYPNSDEYYGCLQQPKKGEKRRAPAWCDRIIWHGKGLKQTNYGRCEYWLSDHRPVRAFFNVEVEVSKDLNALRIFCPRDLTMSGEIQRCSCQMILLSN